MKTEKKIINIKCHTIKFFSNIGKKFGKTSNITPKKALYHIFVTLKTLVGWWIIMQQDFKYIFKWSVIYVRSLWINTKARYKKCHVLNSWLIRNVPQHSAVYPCLHPGGVVRQKLMNIYLFVKTAWTVAFIDCFGSLFTHNRKGRMMPKGYSGAAFASR